MNKAWIIGLAVLTAACAPAAEDAAGPDTAQPPAPQVEPAPAPVPLAPAPVAEEPPAPPPPVMPALPPAPAAATHRTAAHLESYRTVAAAERARGLLGARVAAGHPTLAVPVDLPGKGHWVRVVVDGFATPAEVAGYCRTLRKTGRYCQPVEVTAPPAPAPAATAPAAPTTAAPAAPASPRTGAPHPTDLPAAALESLGGAPGCGFATRPGGGVFLASVFPRGLIGLDGTVVPLEAVQAFGAGARRYHGPEGLRVVATPLRPGSARVTIEAGGRRTVLTATGGCAL